MMCKVGPNPPTRPVQDNEFDDDDADRVGKMGVRHASQQTWECPASNIL